MRIYSPIIFIAAFLSIDAAQAPKLRGEIVFDQTIGAVIRKEQLVAIPESLTIWNGISQQSLAREWAKESIPQDEPVNMIGLVLKSQIRLTALSLENYSEYNDAYARYLQELAGDVGDKVFCNRFPPQMYFDWACSDGYPQVMPLFYGYGAKPTSQHLEKLMAGYKDLIELKRKDKKKAKEVLMPLYMASMRFLLDKVNPNVLIMRSSGSCSLNRPLNREMVNELVDPLTLAVESLEPEFVACLKYYNVGPNFVSKAFWRLQYLKRTNDGKDEDTKAAITKIEQLLKGITRNGFEGLRNDKRCMLSLLPVDLRPRLINLLYEMPLDKDVKEETGK